MHTVMVVGAGLIGLAVFVLASVVVGRGPGTGARLFILPWLAAALVNLYLGTTHGYSVVQELPFFLVVFGVPALVAFAIMRWAGSRGATTA